MVIYLLLSLDVWTMYDKQTVTVSSCDVFVTDTPPPFHPLHPLLTIILGYYIQLVLCHIVVYFVHPGRLSARDGTSSPCQCTRQENYNETQPN